MDHVRAYKKECLLHEHDTLSTYVAAEQISVALTRGAAVIAWAVVTASVTGTAGVIAALATLTALWLSDVYLSYVGVIYKVRRLEVRAHLSSLQETSDAELATWKTPVNPFDGCGRAEKMSALKDAFTSPAVLLPYVILDLTTFVVAALR